MIIKKSEKDERREKIIDVAFRLFVNKKIESVTMGEIAKEAGRSSPKGRRTRGLP